MKTANVNTNANEVKSFNEIYTTYYNRVENFLTAKLNGKRHIAEELTQDTFIKVSQHLENYNSDRAKLSTWIYTIANNQLTDYFRKNKSNQVMSVDSFINENGEPSFQFTDSQEADVSVVSEEKMSAVKRAMNKLNTLEQRIADLYFMQEKQYIEIVEYLNIPMGTVKGVINRLRKKLQKELEQVYAK